MSWVDDLVDFWQTPLAMALILFVILLTCARLCFHNMFGNPRSRITGQLRFEEERARPRRRDWFYPVTEEEGFGTGTTGGDSFYHTFPAEDEQQTPIIDNDDDGDNDLDADRANVNYEHGQKAGCEQGQQGLGGASHSPHQTSASSSASAASASSAAASSAAFAAATADLAKWQDRLRRFEEIAAQSDQPGERDTAARRAADAQLKVADLTKWLSDITHKY